eukprot:CAMPEP_0183395100 /NCGR_PEP_ID=MMETSP0370-20130417/9067_1 /TAXON_ID=268820 /ORGANISM="Peridinium aciculiferum, Strain PAER-2" /LENGTH=421 /DNA_ID=CAMNT_0025575637 /DNA_START=41 /DNA_END=1302 /DNA_ORIENTATION=+
MAPCEDAEGTDGAMVPEDLLCPILHTMFRDPVVNVVGNTYERIALQAMGRKLEGYTDPLTNEVFEDTTLVPNWDMRRRVQSFLDAHPHVTPEGWRDRIVPKPAKRGNDLRQVVIVGGDDAALAPAASEVLFLRCALVALTLATCLPFCLGGVSLVFGNKTIVNGTLVVDSFVLPENHTNSFIGVVQGVADTLEVSPLQAAVDALSNRGWAVFGLLLWLGALFLRHRRVQWGTWSAAFALSLVRCIGQAVLQLGLASFISPVLGGSSLLLLGQIMLIGPAAAVQASELSGVELPPNFVFPLLLPAAIGRHLVVLGVLSWPCPELAWSPAAFSGALLLAIACTLAQLGWNTEGAAERAAMILIGCSGMVWAVVAAFEWCSIDVGDNPLLVCGAALLVIGAAIYEISASRAYQISYGGVVVLVL